MYIAILIDIIWWILVFLIRRPWVTPRQQLYSACPEKTGRSAWEVKKYHRRKGENFLARHSIDSPGKAGGRKGGIIEYNLIEPRVSTPLNRA